MGGAQAIGGATATGGAGACGATGIGGSPGTGCLGPDLDVPVAIISGTIKTSWTSSSTDYGNLYLRKGSDQVLLAPTTSSSYSVRVVPGTYALFYSAAASSTVGPINTNGLIQRDVTIGPTGTTTLDIEVVSAKVDVTITLDGPNAGSLNQDLVYLRSAPEESSTAVNGISGHFVTRLVPGTYDFLFDATRGGIAAPGKTGVTVAAPATTLDVHFPMASLTGALTSNGGALPTSTVGPAGWLTFVNSDGSRTRVVADRPSSLSARIYPGIYDVYYQGVTAGPRNQNAKIKSGVVIPANAATVLNLDVPSVMASAALTVGGATPPSDSRDHAYLLLRNPAASDTVQIGPAASPVAVVPGTYDVVYQWYDGAASPGSPAPSAVLPHNKSAVVKRGVVVDASGASAMAIDVASVTVSGKFSIAGLDGAKASGSGTLALRNGDGDEVVLGDTSAGAYATRVIPGTYDLYYMAVHVGTDAPINAISRLRSNIVIAPGGDTTLDIDVPSTPVSGALTIGTNFFSSQGNTGSLSLTDATPSSFTLGWISNTSYSARLAPGTYDVVYTAYQPGADTIAPKNTKAILGCFRIR